VYFETNSYTKRAVLGGKEKAGLLPDRLQHSLVGIWMYQAGSGDTPENQGPRYKENAKGS